METSVNNKCKAFTSLEQSKKLTEILPLESADMCFVEKGNAKRTWYDAENKRISTAYEKKYYIPCWSLAALLDVLPYNLKIVLAINDFQGDKKEKYVIGSVEHDRYDCYADNPVDACYEMILKLHELNLL